MQWNGSGMNYFQGNVFQFRVECTIPYIRQNPTDGFSFGITIFPLDAWYLNLPRSKITFSTFGQRKRVQLKLLKRLEKALFFPFLRILNALFPGPEEELSTEIKERSINIYFRGRFNETLFEFRYKIGQAWVSNL